MTGFFDARRSPPTVYEIVDVAMARRYRDQVLEVAGNIAGAVPAIDEARDDALSDIDTAKTTAQNQIATDGAAQVALAATQADRAQTAYQNTLAAAGALVVSNYDPYFAPFIDANIDSAGKVLDGLDYRLSRFPQPKAAWPGEAYSANYRARIRAGRIYIKNLSSGVEGAITATAANIRNLRISADENFVFFEQYFGVFVGWVAMGVIRTGARIPFYAEPKDFTFVGDSLTFGFGATNGKLAIATANNPAIELAAPAGIAAANGGWPLAFYLDADVRAQRRKVSQYGLSGNTSTQITDGFLALTDKTFIRRNKGVCFGRNDNEGSAAANAAKVLANFKRIEDADPDYAKWQYFIQVPYRRANEKLPYPNSGRSNIDGINDALRNYVGEARYIRTLDHIIDASASGALQQAIAAGAVASATSQDTADLAAGVPPESLMAIESGSPSDVHYNDAGQQYGWKDPVKAHFVAHGVL